MVKFKEARRQNTKETATAKRDVRRQRASWDRFITNLEHETYRNQPQVYKILKQIRKDKRNSKNSRKCRRKCIYTVL
jgi:hypothetical protein